VIVNQVIWQLKTKKVTFSPKNRNNVRNIIKSYFKGDYAFNGNFLISSSGQYAINNSKYPILLFLLKTSL
jgi:hypothetical protein